MAPQYLSGNELAGKVVVFTGAIQRCDANGQRFTRPLMAAKAREHGAEVDDKIKKSGPNRQYMLVQADPSSKSNKTIDAEAKGALIVGEADFGEMIGE